MGARARTPVPEGLAAGTGGPRPGATDPLLPRGTTDTPLRGWTRAAPWSVPRRYVQKCGTGTLAISRTGGSFTYSALMCGSWNCPTCRRTRSAAELDRLRRGLELHRERSRAFVTLTVDASRFGAVPLGRRAWDRHGAEVSLGSPHAVRTSRIWSEPSRQQFELAAASMSKEWHKLSKRLRRKAERAGVQSHEYYRVVELHRNGWPHYHVVLLLDPAWSASDVQLQVSGWSLGSVTDARDVSIDDAVGELAPYLVSKERKGHKAYQFAAHALPAGFRLIQPSQGWLPATREPSEDVDHALILSGHFTGHHDSLRAWGADVRIVLPTPAPADQPHRPPGRSLARGDGARLYYVAQLEAQPVTLTPEQAAMLEEER